jgi:TonB family protein
MAQKMPTLTGRAHEQDIELIELPPHSRLPRLDLGVDWESPWREFLTSVRDFFTGPRASKESDDTGNSAFRVEWVRGKLSGWAFTASSLWHVAVVLLLILPIWGFLPTTQHNLSPVHIELTYLPAQDLPPISLPGPPSKPSPPGDPAKPLPQIGADAYHPRQTILSIPVKVTHPRQTLIQSDAPAAVPKIDTPLPNMVQWATLAPVKPQIQFSAPTAAPRVRQRAARDVAAPEIANNEKISGPFNVAATPIVNDQPRMPISPMATAATPSNTRPSNQDTGAAPEVGAATSGDSDLHRVIALSAAPAPPAAEVSVPAGNSAARIAISPDGKQPGVPGGAEHGAAGNGGTGGHPDAAGGTNGAGGATRGSGGGGNANANSLPAAISITGGANNGAGGAGGIGSAGSRPAGKLNLKLAPSSEPTRTSHRAPIDVTHLDPSVPSEKILSGKEIYPVHVNMPNLTSITGSWVLNCAQLDEGDSPGYRPAGAFSGPAPLDKVDPKYPQSIIEQHVDGEVVLYAIVRKDGSVDNIQLVRKLDPQLDKYSMEALARWKFRPGTRDGVPIDVEMVVHIPFRFRNPNDQ